jgi:hypothetical protein
MAEKIINRYTLRKHITSDLTKKLAKEMDREIFGESDVAVSYVKEGLMGKEKLLEIEIDTSYTLKAKLYNPNIENFVENYLDEETKKYPKEIKTVCLELMYIPK